MQDCYAFDVGDFGKLGLLRHLHRVTNLRLGVLWWRTILGTTGSDGKHVAYLQNPAFRACDHDLWEEMRRRFNPGARTIAALHPLLPAGTLFHDTPVPARARRSRWLDEAVSSVPASAVVFCDPDNGLTFDEPCRSRRHISVDEIRSLYSCGQSLVVDHTPDRSAPHSEQIVSFLERLRQTIPDLGSSWAARFRRGSSRVFLRAGAAGARSRHRWRDGSNAVDGVGAPRSLRGRARHREGIAALIWDKHHNDSATRSRCGVRDPTSKNDPTGEVRSLTRRVAVRIAARRRFSGAGTGSTPCVFEG